MIDSALVTLSDADLLDLVRQGDESAFTELYARHHEVAQRMAATYCHRGEADDLADLAFEKVLGALRRGHGPTGAFRAYLFVTLRRLAAEHAARHQERPFDELPEPLAAAGATPMLDAVEREMITEAFESLPGRWQAVLWHTAVEGRHPRDLASTLGMSANAVSALAYRARERLRQAYLQAHLRAAPRPECEPHRSTLGAYVRDSQSARERRATAQHLEHCRRCQDLVAELLDINRSLARAVLPLFAAVPGVKLGPVLGGSTVAPNLGRVAKRSMSAWLQMHPVRGAVGAVAASSAVLFGITLLQPHIGDAGTTPPRFEPAEGRAGEAAGEAVGEAVDAAGSELTATTHLEPVLAAAAKPCDVATAGASATSDPASSGSGATAGAGGTTTTAVPVTAALGPVVGGLAPTTTLAPGSATLTEVACTATAPGHGDLTVVVTAPEGTEARADGSDGGDPLVEGLPLEAEVTVDLSDGARVAVEAGLPAECDVAGDRQTLTCTLDALLPGAPIEATVGLEVDVPQGGAPSATVTLSNGDEALVSQTLDLSPVTGLLAPSASLPG